MTPPNVPKLGALLRPLPLLPLQIVVDALARGIARRRPAIFTRLGPHAGRVLVVDPRELPFCFVLDTAPRRPGCRVRRASPPDAAAVISGPLLALVALARGRLDADALFFSREIDVAGDMEAALALRNALDDAEVDVLREAAALAGPFAPALASLLDAADRRQPTAEREAF